MFANVDVSFFLATTNADECKAFYSQVMGLTLRDENKFALVYDLKGVELRISKVSSFSPHPFTALDWQVDDLEDAMAVLKERGVVFTIFGGMGQDENGIWAAPDGSANIAWFKDLDDNVLSLSKRFEWF